MQIQKISSNNQNFQARIKMNKANLNKIVTTVSLVTTGVASLAVQTDFDAAISQSTVPSTAYQGSTIPFINKLHEGGTPAGNLLGASSSTLLTAQVPSYAGLQSLDAASGKNFSDKFNNIDFNNDKAKELGLVNLMSSSCIAMMLTQSDLDPELLSTMGTTAVPLASSDISALAEAYEKSNSDDKIPS